MSLSPVAAAGYVSAVLSGDSTAERYVQAFTPAELLDAMTSQLTLLARYLGYMTDFTLTEIGDALVLGALAVTKQKEQRT